MKQSRVFSPFFVVFCLSAIVSLLLIVIIGPVEYPDTQSYISAWDKISKGDIDTFRTPLYPIVIGLAKSISGIYWKWTVVVLQYLLFLLSVKYFFKIASTLSSSKCSLILTAFYGIYPTFNSWSNLLLTDSLSMSLTVFLVFACLKIIRGNSLKHVFIMTAMLFLLLSLRPQNISLLPAIALSFFIMFFYKKLRFASLMVFCGLIVCSVALILYTNKVKQKTGLFTPSVVSVYNEFTLARMYGYILPEVIEDAQLSEHFKRNYDKYGQELVDGPLMYEALNDLSKEISVSQMKDIVNKSIKANPKLWFKGLLKRSYFASLMPAMTSYASDLFRIHPLFLLNIGFIILISILSLAMTLIRLRHHTADIIDFLFAMLTLGVIAVSVIGAQYEYNRLILSIIPLAFIMLARLITFSVKLVTEKYKFQPKFCK